MNLRYDTLPNAELINAFKSVGGYFNFTNRDLAKFIINMELFKEGNRNCDKNLGLYTKWSFTVSFLMMMNAWQWFLSGIFIGQAAYLPAQIMQMYYYSIFYSYRSFLAFQLRGSYTLKIEHRDPDLMYEAKIRRDVWISSVANIEIGKPEEGIGEHEKTAFWFYRVFDNWGLKTKYPDVSTFVKNRKWHVYFRNLYTYSLADIAEELYGELSGKQAISSKELLGLWNRESDLVDCFPEEYWGLEHLKVVTELHLLIFKTYGSLPNLISEEQKRLLAIFYDYYYESELRSFMYKVFGEMRQVIDY